MMYRQHWLMLFDKPKVSSAFLRRYPALHWKHRTLAMGGFDTASCQLPVGRTEAEWFFENAIANRAALMVNNPFDFPFEGLISRITLTLPGIVMTRSLDEMGNRIVVTQTTSSTAAMPTPAAAVNNTDSQAIYGIKNKTERAARAVSATTFAASLSARALNDLAYPITSVASNDGSVSAMIELEITGFYYTLAWENDGVSAGTRQVRNGSTGWFDVMLSGHANGTTFISASAVDLTNNTQTYPGTSEGGTTWEKARMLAECGNNAQRWITGVGPYDWNAATRRLYLRPADTTVKYLAKVNQPGKLFTPAGAPVEPWTVTPDGMVQIADVLTGWDSDGTDPRQAYLAALEYDADAGRVSWQSDDNITIPGAFQIDKFHTSSDQKYGQRASQPMM